VTSPNSPADAAVLPNATDLSPSYRIPGALIGIAIPLALVQIWLGALVGLFGIFLLVQAFTLTLRFTPDALAIYRGDSLIRHFPYAEWEHWEIFWSPMPILFYFREVNSIHFLPIIFSPTQLRSCLESHCPSSSVQV
jgi:hypothetical protein